MVENRYKRLVDKPSVMDHASVPKVASPVMIETGLAAMRAVISTDYDAGKLRWMLARVWSAMLAEAEPPISVGGLSRRQAEVLGIVLDTYERTGRTPTPMEIGPQLGTSRQYAGDVLRELMAKGFLRPSPIGLKTVNYRILRRV